MRTSRPLLLVGIVSEAVYFALTVKLPWWRYGGKLRSWSSILGNGQGSEDLLGAPFAACLLAVILLMAAYVWGWSLVRRGRVDRRLVWGGACVFAATLFWLLPITADLFVYLSQAHKFTDLGQIPLLAPGPGLEVDPLLSAYSIEYLRHPSVYGPAWILISSPATLGKYDVAGGVAYLKGLAAVCYLASAWLLERILRTHQPERALESLYLFAWNPLVLLMAVGDGHNDIVMMAAVLVSVWCALQGRWGFAWAALAFSIWVKYVSLILVPVLLLCQLRQLHAPDRSPRAWHAGLRGGLAVLLVSAAAILPFGSPAWVVGLGERLFQPANWRLVAPGLASIALWVGAALFVLAFGLLLWRHARARLPVTGLLDLAFVAFLLAFIVGAARTQPWHLLWPAALAGLSARRWAWPVVVALSGVLLSAQIWIEWGAPGWYILS